MINTNTNSNSNSHVNSNKISNFGNNNNHNNNILMKNEILKSMLTKITEEAKQQFSEKNEKVCFNENYLDEEKENNIDFFEKISNANNSLKNSNPTHEQNNENFTQEYFKERYKNFIPSNPVTPTNFNQNLESFFNMGDQNYSSNIQKFSNNSSSNNSDPSNSSKICLLIQAKLTSEFLNNKLKEISLFNWLRIYNELNEGKKINLDFFLNFNEQCNFYLYQKLQSFFSQFTFNADKEVFIAQIYKIKFVDCLQILELKDFQLNEREIIVTSEEMYDNDNYSINSLLKDTQFRLNEVIVIKSKSVKEMKIGLNKLFMVDLKSLKQLRSH